MGGGYGVGPGRTRLTADAGRRFGFSLGPALLGLAAISLWRGHSLPAWVLAGCGVTLVLMGIIAPAALGPVRASWIKVGRAISKVTTPIVLGVVYFGVVMPLGLLLSLWGRNPLRHRAREGSYWAAVPSDGRSNLDHQY